LANYFYRKPIIGGDNNTWAAFNDAWIRSSIGEYTSYLFDNSGTLTLSPGRVGINDGTNEGIAIIDANTTITITGTNARWYKIELSVSSTSVTIASSVLTGSDASTLPTELTAGYITTKQGFYDDSTKRLLGVVWKNAAGTLAGIINCGNMIKGYSGYAYLNAGLTAIMKWNKTIDILKRIAEIQIGSWNMYITGGGTGSNSKSVIHGITEWGKIKQIEGYVVNDANDFKFTFPANDNAVPIKIILNIAGADATTIYLQIFSSGSWFDSTDFNATTNRGNLYLDLEE
jgi:hypothetical protein